MHREMRKKKSFFFYKPILNEILKQHFMFLPAHDASIYRLIDLNIFDYIIKLFKRTFFVF